MLLRRGYQFEQEFSMLIVNWIRCVVLPVSVCVSHQLGFVNFTSIAFGISILYYWVHLVPCTLKLVEHDPVFPPYVSRAQLLDLTGKSSGQCRYNPYWETCMEIFVKCNINAAYLLDVGPDSVGNSSEESVPVEVTVEDDNASLWSGLELVRGVVRRAESQGLGENVMTELVEGSLGAASTSSSSSSLFAPSESASDLSIVSYEEDEDEETQEEAGSDPSSDEATVEERQAELPTMETREMSKAQVELHRRLTASKAVFERFGVWPGTVSGSRLPSVVEELKEHSEVFRFKIAKLTGSFNDEGDIGCTEGWPDYETEPLEFINLGEGMLIYRKKKLQELCKYMEEIAEVLGKVTSLQRISQRGEVNFLVGRAQQIEYSANAWIQKCDKLLDRAWKYRERGSHDAGWIDHKLKRELRLAKTLAEFFEETQQANFYASIPQSCENLASDYWNLVHNPIEI